MKFIGTLCVALLLKISLRFKAFLRLVGIKSKIDSTTPTTTLEQDREDLEQFLSKQPEEMFGIGGWNQLEGTLPGKRHGYGCKCWSCLSQIEEPYFG